VNAVAFSPDGATLAAGSAAADEPLGVLLVGAVEHTGAGGVQPGSVAVVNGGRGHQADPGMAVLVGVPVDERAAVLARRSMQAKRAGKSGR